MQTRKWIDTGTFKIGAQAASERHDNKIHKIKSSSINFIEKNWNTSAYDSIIKHESLSLIQEHEMSWGQILESDILYGGQGFC